MASLVRKLSRVGARLATAILLLLGASQPHAAGEPVAGEASPPVLALVNGRWLTGDGFTAKTMYTEGGVLRAERPAAVDATVDLAGGYVVPPFGEAHTHRPANPDQMASDASFFLADGIFYVMNQGSLARYGGAFRHLVDRPESVDALFAGALIASPQSHGVELWQRLVGRGAFPGVAADELEGDAYFILESADDLNRRWPEILATEPGFLKVMIEHSEAYDSRRADPQYFGRSGLDPELVPEIVSRAHAAGLRVSAHIETAADFQLAVSAGVDLVAHLPGYDIPAEDDPARYRIAAADAALAAERGTIVVTTTLLSVDRAEDEPARLERMRENQRQNLRVLSQAGVEMAVGSDQFSKNAVDEVINLAGLGVLDNPTLLEMLCSVTPRAIFPGRRVGALVDGAEASLLVLGSDPIQRIDRIRDITLRFKDGRALAVP